MAKSQKPPENIVNTEEKLKINRARRVRLKQRKTGNLPSKKKVVAVDIKAWEKAHEMWDGDEDQFVEHLIQKFVAKQKSSI